MIFYGIILRPSPYPNALFPPCLHFCLGPHAVSLKSWILGSFHSSLFLHPRKTRILLLNLILTTRSLPPFEKLLCLPLADNHLNLLVVKIHVLCTYSKLVQMEGQYDFTLVSKPIQGFHVLIWLPGRVSFSICNLLTPFPPPAYLTEKIDEDNVPRYRGLFFAEGDRSSPLS